MALKIWTEKHIKGVWEEVQDYVNGHEEEFKGRHLAIEVYPCGNKKRKFCQRSLK